MLRVNEQPYGFIDGTKLADLAHKIKPGADVYIVNGFPMPPETILEDGDNCWLIKKGERPTPEDMEHLLYARHTPGVQEKIKGSSVGVMGLGGLGSVVSLALARIGVGKLILADYDVVEPSNLNRQQFFVDQVGMRKTDAMRENLARVNPYLQVETLDEQLTAENIPLLFSEVDVLAECFDGAETKAMGMRAVMTAMPEVGYVGSSGMAGFADNNSIITRKIRSKIYVVGDGEAEAKPGQGLMAPRVGIAAHHQANQVLRILLGQG